MAQTYQCVCGAQLEYRHDLTRKRSPQTPTWRCADCQTPVPSVIAERISHQHPT